MEIDNVVPGRQTGQKPTLVILGLLVAAALAVGATQARTISDLEAKVSRLERKANDDGLDDLMASVDKLTSQLEDVGSDTYGLQNELETLKSELDGIPADFQTLKNDLDGIPDDVETLRSDLDSLESDMALR